ncbi:MAG: PT domain-containing protein [Myxococcota bacterium]|nr:PT domain-containing protein [Myxococcota bacterium]
MLYFLLFACGDLEKDDSSVEEATEDTSSTPTSEPTDEPGEPTDEPTSEPTSEPTDEPTSEPTDEPSSEPTSEPTDEPEEPATILLGEGDWIIGSTTVLSDVCEIENYNDVTGFTPDGIGVADSTESDFRMLPDNLLCVRDDLSFTCDPISFTQEAIIGADLVITNTIRGDIETEDTMMLYFDIDIEECQGWSCGLIELALPFPCPIELEAPASR